MLVIERKVGEHVILRIKGLPDITVKLHEVRGNKRALIAFEAPPEVKIERPERLAADSSEEER